MIFTPGGCACLVYDAGVTLLVGFFLGLIALLILVFAGTFLLHLLILKVPYVPTPMAIVREMVRLADLKGTETVYDLGAGDGRLLILAKKQQPGITAIGIEAVPTVWLLALLRAWFSRVRIIMRVGNALRQDVHNADVIFLYLMPSLMEKLESKFDLELKPGARVISHTFPFPSRTPTKEVTVAWGRGWKKLYVYDW